MNAVESRLYNILYSCTYQQKRGVEHFVEEHALGYIVSGSVEFFTNNHSHILGEGTMGLIGRNQLAKTIKHPPKDGGRFQAINIILTQDALKTYSNEHKITASGFYHGESMLNLGTDNFLKGYFNSLLPYFDTLDGLSLSLASLKTQEAIALLLRHDPRLKDFLFDFNEPHKIDIQAFMQKNFHYHASIGQFAKLTGRSLSTFKRDFQKTFETSPERWLLQKRLEHAHFLIAQKRQTPLDVYIEVGFENLSHFSSSFKRHFGYNASSIQV
jgi:AraC-like DNA-binding protein